MHSKAIFLSILLLTTLACTASAGTLAMASTPTATETHAGAVWTPRPTSTAELICLRALTDVHVRARPDEKSNVLFWLYKGNQIKVSAFDGAWTWTGRGYVKSKYLEKCR
jgi:hypothetical protein